MELTLLLTCDPNVMYCKENGLMYVTISENNKIAYVLLVDFLKNPTKYKLLLNKGEL